MTEYEDLKPFFDEMLGIMKKHDFEKGDSWKEDTLRVERNLRLKLWEEFKECIEWNNVGDVRNPSEFVDLANVCAMIWLRHLDAVKEVNQSE